MSKESREIERLNPDEEVGKKRKIVFWSMIATGIGVIVVIALLLIFLLPKDDKFEIDLGSNVSVEDGTLTGEGSYKKGDSVTIVAEDIDGYRFTGWSYGGSIISTDKEYTFQINEENEGEYTANYAKIYSVSTFDNNQYGSFTVAPTEAIAGETVTVRYEVNSENQDKYQLKRLYYVIAGESDQVTIENNRFTMPEGNVTIYAEFNNLYNINLTTNIDEEVDLTGEGTYIENETVTISAPDIAGYRFRNWTYNGNIVTTQQEYTIANIDSTTSGTYIANYDRLYSITVNSSHGTVLIDGGKTNAIENENIEFTVEPNSDYRLIEVKVNNEILQAQDGKYSFAMPAENVTIVVTYIQQFDVILQSDMENADLSGADTYDIGSEVTITASTYVEDQDGNQYRFIGWQHNEEFIPVEDGGIYEFILSADTAGTYTAIYESAYKVEVEENSAQYIQIESTQAFEDDNITFTASVEDTVSDTEVIIKSIKIMANGEEIEYTNDGNQYSFIMPAGNVLISVVEEIRSNIIKDFVISGNRIIQYTGTDSEVVVPSTYYAYQQESDGILEFDSFDALNSYMQQELGRYQLGGGYFTYKLNDSEYSEEIKDVQAWLSEMQTHSGDSEFNLTIKLPTGYTVTEEDAVELGNNLEFSVLSPFYQLYMSSDYIISFTYQIGDSESVSVDANNIGEIVEKTLGNKQPEAMLPIKFTNIKYGKVIVCEGDTNVITSIGDEAFVNCSNLTNISMPNSITYIGDGAFSGCNNLKYNEYNNGKYLGNNENPYLVLVDVIDTSASEFYISEACQIIYGYAFSGCRSLTEITLPASLTSIGSNAFDGCNSLATVTFAEDSKLKSIGDYAFQYCSGLTKITLPSSLTSIGHYAFFRCSGLTEITLPSSLTSIGINAYYGCSGSTEIYYQGTIDQWLNMTFGRGWNADNNTNLYINDELVDEITINADIPSYAFDDIYSITKVTIGEGVTSIGGSAFSGCSNLTEITLPASLTSIGSYAFDGCNSLATVTFAEDSKLKSIGDNAFSFCSNLTEITLPSSLTSIGDRAFAGCSNLATVTIESDDIYKNATSTYSAGYLLQKATTVRVLTRIVNTWDNSYLENTSNFTTSGDGEYTVFTKVN